MGRLQPDGTNGLAISAGCFATSGSALDEPTYQDQKRIGLDRTQPGKPTPKGTAQ